MSNQRRLILLLMISLVVAFLVLLREYTTLNIRMLALIGFFGLIGVLFYSHFEESNIFFKYYPKHRSLKNYNKSILFVYAKLLEADGNVSADELRNAKKIIKKDFDKRYKPEHFEFLKSSMGIKVNIKLPLLTIFENFGSPFCMLFISNLVRLAATDSIMTIEEERFIRNVAKELKIGERAFNSILERHSFILESERKRKSAHTSSLSIGLDRSFKILGLSKTNNFAEVKKTYRDLVKIHHPDKIRDKSLKESAKEQFQVITEAYETIKNKLG